MSTSQSQVVHVALDGMGGDFAPEEIARGAVEAARRQDVAITLVGPEERLEAELAACDQPDLPLRLHHTDQFIADGEAPSRALRAKPEASVLVCARLVKGGEVDAAVSMGHTGASMVAAHWAFERLPGIRRPVAGGPLSFLAPRTVAFDLGTNVECEPRQLLQFAGIGAAYARCMLGIAEPTVGLLSNGSEPGKGTTRTRAAYELLDQSELNFIGYVEGWDLPAGRADVVVCDGFVGNALLKYSEGVGRVMSDWLRQRLEGALKPSQCRALSDELAGMFEVERRIGGAPLIGMDEVMVVGHGRSRAPTVARAIEQARRAVEQDLIGTLKAELARVAG